MRIIDYVDRGLAVDPQRPLLISDAGVLTHGQAFESSQQIAAALRGAGMKVGDTVGILAPNVPQGLVTMFGVWRAGGVWAPLNPYNAISATEKFMADAECRWLFLHSSFAEHAESLRKNVPGLDHVVCLDQPFDGGIDMAAFLAGGVGVEVEDWGDPYGRPDLPCIHWPTGGTTGWSKVVVWTNRVWTSLMETASRHWPTPDHPVNLAVAPMTHAAGVMAVIYASLGGTIVLRTKFDAEDVLDQIERHRVTHLFLPPTAFYDLCEAQQARRRDCSSLAMLLISAAPVSPRRMAEGVELFGPCVAQCWGQAEAPFILTWLSPQDVAEAVAGVHPERLGSCGRPTFSSQVAAMAPDGTLLPPGERGELVARSGLVTPGYLGQEAETAEMRRFGWHHTGDVGYLDEHGYAYIVDRLKDMIITGGFNVYAAEVEAALLMSESVQACAVVGAPHPRWGEEVVAFVVPATEDGVDADQLAAMTRSQLGSVKAPKVIHVVDALPHTAVGKIDKKAIRAMWIPDAVR